MTRSIGFDSHWKVVHHSTYQKMEPCRFSSWWLSRMSARHQIEKSTVDEELTFLSKSKEADGNHWIIRILGNNCDEFLRKHFIVDDAVVHQLWKPRMSVFSPAIWGKKSSWNGKLNRLPLVRLSKLNNEEWSRITHGDSWRILWDRRMQMASSSWIFAFWTRFKAPWFDWYWSMDRVHERLMD